MLNIGCYKFINNLGHGSMGTVYEAKNTETGELVAIKVIEKHHLI